MGKPEKMKFVFPCEACEAKAKAYIQEFYDRNSAVNGSGGLDWCLQNEGYAAWLRKVRADADIANIPRKPCLGGCDQKLRRRAGGRVFQ